MFRFYREQHPHPRFGPANVVTSVRALLVVVVALLGLLSPSLAVAWLAGSLAGVAIALDGLDGHLARRTHLQSAFGARFDMETDAALLLVLSVLLWRLHQAGAWILLAGGLRYLWIGGQWLLPWMNAPLSPTLRGKTVAVTLLITCAVCLVVPRWLASTACALALTLLFWSFAVDVGRLWKAHQTGSTFR